MIYTWTLNPAIDYRLEVDELELGTLNRADFNKFTAGGKGINVSIVLKQMGVSNVAIGFIGGFTGKYLSDFLKSKYELQTDFVTIQDNTRINVKLASDVLTEINARSPMVTDDELAKLFKKVNRVTINDLVVLAGSSIKSQKGIYEKLAKLFSENSIPFVADLDQNALKEVISYGPFVIKQNLYELERYFGVSMNEEHDIVAYGKKLLEKGTKHVLISLGLKGSYYIGEDIVYRAEPLSGKVRNTVGTGDSMLAGFIGTLSRTKDIKKAYKWAVAAGSATAFSYGLAKLDEISVLLDQVKIRTIYK